MTTENRVKMTMAYAIATVFALGCAKSEKLQPDEDQFLIQEIQLEGVTKDPSAVKVGEVVDEDNKNDTKWKASFPLDGADSPKSLSKDVGGKQSHEITIKANRNSDGREVQKKVTITLHE